MKQYLQLEEAQQLLVGHIVPPGQEQVPFMAALGRVVYAGEDLQEGELVAEEGMVVTSPLIGLLAGMGLAKVWVYRRIKALVLACDMPLVPVRLLEAVVGLTKGVDLVIRVHSRGYEPLCAWYDHKGACL